MRYFARRSRARSEVLRFELVGLTPQLRATVEISSQYVVVTSICNTDLPFESVVTLGYAFLYSLLAGS